MIRTNKVKDNTRATFKGDLNEAYRDFRTIINMIFEHTELVDPFMDAWDDIVEENGGKRF